VRPSGCPRGCFFGRARLAREGDGLLPSSAVAGLDRAAGGRGVAHRRMTFGLPAQQAIRWR